MDKLALRGKNIGCKKEGNEQHKTNGRSKSHFFFLFNYDVILIKSCDQAYITRTTIYILSKLKVNRRDLLNAMYSCKDVNVNAGNRVVYQGYTFCLTHNLFLLKSFCVFDD